MQSWGARLKAAISGEVEGGDVQALLAATTPLAGLQQTLADRRLESEIAHIGQEWQAAIDLAPIAGPLWLAEALVTLAGALVDAEADAHPERSTLLSAISHHQALALLEPVGPLLLDISATLADPGHRSAFSLPLLVGRQGVAVDTSVSYLPVAYVRGLLLGLDRLEGATTQGLEVTTALVGRSPAPPWLMAGIQRLRGDLSALDTRLEILRAQGAALLGHPTADSAALHQLAAALWSSIDVLLDIGQAAGTPLLLPGAQVPPPPGDAASRGAPTPAQAQRPASPIVPAPPAAGPAYSPAVTAPAPPAPVERPRPSPPPQEPARTLPEIAPTWQGSGVRAPSAPTTVKQPEDTGPRPMPEILSGAVQRPNTGRTPRDSRAGEPRPVPQQAHSLPRIDDIRRPEPPRDRGAGAPPTRPPDAANEEGAPREPAGAGRRIDRKDRWLLSSTAARHRLRANGGEDDAERRLAAYWEARSWTLSASGAGYLDQIGALAAQGAVTASGRSLADVPYAPIYKVTASDVALLGQRLAFGALVAFDYRHDRLLLPGPKDGVAD